MTNWPDCVVRLAEAIAKAEGFGIVNALPTIANNPGDLSIRDAGSFKTLGEINTEGVVKFLNLADGWQALYLKVNRMLSGKSTVYSLDDTLEAAGLKYSGGDTNWAKNVAAALGVPVTATLREISES